MDKTWELVQKKTFTNWFNAQLKRGGHSKMVEDLANDLDNGILLYQLLECISGQKLPRIMTNPRMRLQKIQNLNVCLDFIARSGVRLIGISSEEICDHNQKLILGMVWTLILRFEIQDISIEDLTAKEGLLYWCQKKTAGYRDVHVKDFTRSWHDGLAFCALIHKHRPDLIDFDSLSKENNLENLELAFKVAEEKLGIPRFMDPEDVAVADDRSIMTYLMQYFRCFAGSQKAEVAGRRISKLVGLLKNNEELRADYEARAKEWCDWADAKLEELTSAEFDNTLEGAKKQLEALHEYQKEEKPNRAGQKFAIEGVYNNLQVNLRNNGRAPYVPPEGITPKDIGDKWAKLLAAERERERAIRDELARQQKLENMSTRFFEKLAKIKAWEKTKKEYLAQRPTIDTLVAAKSQEKLLEGYSKLYEDSKSRVADLHKLGDELIEMNYRDSEKVKEELAWTDDAWKALADDEAEKRKWLEEQLALQQEMERLRLEFAEKAKSLQRWYKDTIEAVGSDSAFGDNLQEVEAYKEKLDEKDEALRKESAEKKEELEKIAAEMERLGVKDNKYTVITMDDINASEKNFQDALAARQDAYQKELERQRAMEEKRIEFANAAQEFVDWLAEQRKQIDELQNDDPDALVQAIEEIVQEHKPSQEKLDNVRRIDQECIAMQITSNPHTKYTVGDLESEFYDQQTYTERYIDSLHEEKERKNKYAERAQRLMDWINETKPKMEEREIATNLTQSRAKRTSYDNYRRGQKPPKSAEKTAVLSLAKSLAKFMQKSQFHRPPFVPPEGLAPEDIEKAWAELGEKERELEAFIAKEIQRHERLAALEKKLHEEAADTEKWADKKVNYLQRDEVSGIHSVDDAQVCLHRMDVFSDEFAKKKPRLEAMKGDAQTLTDEQQDGAEKATERVNKIGESFENMAALEAQHREALTAALESEKKKEALRRAFAEKAKAYVRWGSKTTSKLEDAVFGKTLDEVREFQATAEKTEADIREENQKRLDECKQLAAELKEAGVEHNNHTNVTEDDLDRTSEKVEKAVAKYDEDYKKELARQEEMEAKRVEFAEAAEALNKMLEESRAAIDAFEGEDPVALAEQVKARFNEAADEHAKLADVERLYGEELRLEITENKHTELTADGLKKAVREYQGYVNAYVSELEDEASMRSKYDKRAGDLVAWIAQAEQDLSSGAKDPKENTLQAAQAAMDDFTDYRDGTKPNKVVEGDAVKALYKTASETLAASQHHRPEFKPAAPECTPEAIDEAFAKLGEAEKAHFDKISETLAKQEDLYQRSREFNEQAQDLEKWCKESEESLTSEEDAQTVEAAQIAEDILATFDKDYAEVSEKDVEPLKKLAEGLVADDYCEKDAVDARCKEVVAAYEALKAIRDAREEKNKSQKDREMNKEKLRKQWAKEAKQYDRWIADNTGKVAKYVFGGNLEQVREGCEKLAEAMGALRKESDDKKAQLDELAAKMTEAGITENVHSSITVDDVAKFHQTLEDAIAKREAAYNEELKRQEEMEAKRVAFAEKANAFLELVQQNRAALEGVQHEDPVAAIEEVQKIYDEKKPLDAALAECAAIDTELRSMKVTDNKHTPHTMGSLNRKLVAHQKFYENLLGALQEEKMMLDRKGEREAEWAKKEKTQALRSEYAENQAKLSSWTDAVNEAIEGVPEAHSVEDVDELRADFDSVAAEPVHAESKATFEKLCELQKALEEDGVPASEVSHDENVQAWEHANQLIDERRKWLDDEHARQEKIAAMCKDFAEQAEAFHNWIEECKNADNAEGSLEEQLEAVKKLRETVDTEGPQKKDALVALDAQISEEGVKENSETVHTVASLTVEFEGLQDNIKSRQALVEQQINGAKYSLPPDQVKEFLELFDQFDKDHTGALNWYQFKACLSALGEDVSDDNVKKIISETDKDGSQTIDRDEFVQYMTKKLSDSDSKEDVIAAFKDIADGRDFVTLSELAAVMPPDQLKFIEENAPRKEGQPDAIDFAKWTETAFA